MSPQMLIFLDGDVGCTPLLHLSTAFFFHKKWTKERVKIAFQYHGFCLTRFFYYFLLKERISHLFVFYTHYLPSKLAFLFLFDPAADHFFELIFIQVVNRIQKSRKKAGLEPTDVVEVYFEPLDEEKHVLERILKSHVGAHNFIHFYYYYYYF